MSNEKLSCDELVRYAVGELDADQAVKIGARVAASANDARRLVRIRSLLKTLEERESVLPPEELVERVCNLVAGPALQKPEWLQRLQRLIANLVFDSRRQPATAGYRATGSSAQLSYESDLADIDLELERLDNGLWLLLGHVASDETVGTVEVVLVEKESQSVAAVASPDEFGVFRITAPTGSYQLAIRVGDQTVEVPDLELG